MQQGRGKRLALKRGLGTLPFTPHSQEALGLCRSGGPLLRVPASFSCPHLQIFSPLRLPPVGLWGGDPLESPDSHRARHPLNSERLPLPRCPFILVPQPAGHHGSLASPQGLAKKTKTKTVFLTFSPPTWRGNSPEAPPVRRHKMKAAQCRTRLQTQSPRGTWKPHACPHSLEHHPPTPASPISPFPPACFPFLGAGGWTEESPALWRLLPASVPIFPWGRAHFCSRAVGARWAHTAISRCDGAVGARPGAPLGRLPLGRNVSPQHKLEALQTLHRPDPRPPRCSPGGTRGAKSA
ncbi:unnamed protein product [Rangifer tarandus platyrhynchus]|uniref:Uncharacterized protein n=1 Tax=Rangifer tarandus platyrhynchus TaxID=3082113 RepID=A0AC59Z554_RANTA